MMNRTILAWCLLILILTPSWLSAQTDQPYWQRLKPGALDTTQRDVTPTHYETFALDLEALKNHLAQAPAEHNSQGATLAVALPDDRGGFQRYAITRTQVLHPDLAARYPTIQTFVGRGLDQPTHTIRLDLTEWGFHAQVRGSEEGTLYLEPFSRQTTAEYMAYRANDAGLSAEDQMASCGVNDRFLDDLAERRPGGSAPTRNGTGSTLLTYRLAVAADVLYSNYHGGTQSSVLSALTTAVNNVNGIFETDFAIRFELVPDNDQLIFLTDSVDPYTDNGNPPSMLNENQGVVDGIVGNGAYDVGHAFTDLSGGLGVAGIAFLRSACNSNSKARGVSGNFVPTGASFVRIVAHELGHQFAANHIFNTDDSQCFNNRRAIAAYEPGGGSTIMSYAGACIFNLQGDADDYFNVANYDEVIEFSRNGGGASCAVSSLTNNTPPTVEVGPSGLFIPRETPFELTAEGNDVDGDAITYCWEQHDLGPAGNPNTPEGNAPIFRSFPPTQNPTRVFPRLRELVSGSTAYGETFARYTRGLSFRATVRDNNPAGGGVAYKEVSLGVTEQSGPFRITFPNDFDALSAAEPLTITWDPANTQVAPVRCSAVDIFMSTDGGLTYPIQLAEGTPNDGQATVFLPDTSVNRVRFKVKAADNVFFDISNRNATINPAPQPGVIYYFEPDPPSVCLGKEATLRLRTAGRGGAGGTINVLPSNVPDELTVDVDSNDVAVGDNLVLNLEARANATPGTYTFRMLLTTSEGLAQLETLEVQVLDGDDIRLELVSDPEGERNQSTRPHLAWRPIEGISDYTVQISTSPLFAEENLVANVVGLRDTTYQVDLSLNPTQVYFWRVGTDAACGALNFSETQAFQVGDCETYAATDLPRVLSPNSPATARSRLEVTGNALIADLNLLDVSGNHTGFGDLSFTLSKLGGPSATLVDRSCGRVQANFNFLVDDESPISTVECVPDQGVSYQSPDPLSVFDGQQISGEYEFSVQDFLVGEGGTLDSWALELCQAMPNPPLVINNNPLSIKQYLSETISRSELLIASPRVAEEDIRFVLVSTPAHGSVKLDGNNLKPGDTFTQADLDSNKVSYLQAGALVEADSFRFTVEAPGTGWLGLKTFRIQIQENTSLEVAPSSQLEVFPNPSEGRITVVLNGWAGSAQLSVYHLTGQRLRHETLRPQGEQLKTVVSLEDQPAGLYLFEVHSQAGTFTRRVWLK